MKDASKQHFHDRKELVRLMGCIKRKTCSNGSHMLGSAIGMGYLENPEGIDDEWILSGKYEIDVEGKRIPAKVHLHAPYDPKGERVRM